MTVVYNTNFTHNPNSYLTLAIEDAARQVFGADNVVLADNRTLAPLGASGMHDVLICIDGQRMHEGLLRRVRNSFKTIVMWLFEDPFMLDYNVGNMGLFDHIFTNDPACVRAYGDKGHYLPLAASQRFHFRPVKDDAELDYDIFFAGTMWPNRIRSLRQVITAFPEARLKLVCPTNEYLPPLPSDLARLAIQWPVSHESFIDFANASRVTLTMFRDYASHGDVGQATAPGPRLFELGLSGTAQVVECGDQMDGTHFDAVRGVELVRDNVDLVAGIRRILGSPRARAERARQTQEQVAAAQLYTHRLERIRDVTRADFGVRRTPVSSIPAARKLRVLMCTHSTIHRNVWGGVEVYQQTLTSMFERDVDVFFWLRLNGQCHLTNDEGEVLERFDMPDVGWLDSLTDAAEEAAFSNVISEYSFDLVHFQHLGHHTSSLPIIAKACGVGTVFSAHDFFLVCARYNLLNHDQVFCDIGNKSISACDICLRISENVPAGAQQTRRTFMAEVIRSIDVFLFGTEYSEALSLKIYPQLAKHRRAVLGIPMPTSIVDDAPPVHAEDAEAPLVIAVVGNFLRSKGADAVMSLMEEANPQLFTFHLLGNADAQYAEILNRWNKPNVTYHGRYTPADFSKIASADVALHLSIWPETYCISLSEMWQKGLIPIVSDIGAFSDRVTHGVNGYKVDIGDVSAVLDCLELLRSSPATRRAIRANIGPHLWTDYRGYAAALLDIYRSTAPLRPLGPVGLGLDVGQVHLLPHPSWKVLAPPRHIFDPSRRSTIRLELPAAIQDWSHVQGSELHIDSVCGLLPEMLKRDRFQPASELQIRGWTFVPGVRVGGQILVALVGDGDGPVIFFPASRDIRDDIISIFPAAPRRSGFEGRIALRGKWCEGRYGVAIVNSFGDRASFCLTPLQVTIEGGRVTNAALASQANDRITRAFYRVAQQTGEEPGAALSALPLKAQAWQPGQKLQHHIDQVAAVDSGEGAVASGADDGLDLASRAFRIRGWAFVPGAGLNGRLYAGLVDQRRGARIFVPLPREVRDDVMPYFSDAPLCSGFSGQVEVPAEWHDGTFAIALVAVVNGEAWSHALGVDVTVRGGRIAGIVTDRIDAATVARIEALLKGSRVAEIPIAVTAPSVAEMPASDPVGEPASKRRRAAVR